MAAEGEQVEGGGENTQVEMSPTETQAREQGWVPKEEFNGEEHKWVDSAEFLRRGELFGKIESQNKELRQIRETLALFKDHHSKVQESAYKRALDDLKVKKKEALLEGDADAVIEVDEEIYAVKQDQKQLEAAAKAAPQETEEHPEFTSWKNKNSWYENHKSMRVWADIRGVELAREGKTPAEVLKAVEKEARSEFPHKFENPNRTKPGAVETTAGRQGKGGGEAYQPNETERSMAKKFVKQGLFKNEQEYYNELRSM